MYNNQSLQTGFSCHGDIQTIVIELRFGGPRNPNVRSANSSWKLLLPAPFPMSKESIFFHTFAVDSQVFFKSKYTYALVNLKPLVPGHVLVVPLRTSVIRFGDLTPPESADYMMSLQLIQKFIYKAYKADSLNIAIQDGPESGQSVPHLHTHLIPRYKADTHDDSIHTQLEKTDLGAAYAEFFERKASFQKNGTWKSVADEDRHARTAEVMAKEAQWLKEELDKYIETSA